MATLDAHTLTALPASNRRRFLSRYVRVFTGTACNQRCVSCPFPADVDRSFRSKAEIQAGLLSAKEKGATGVILSGGEPTIHPEMPALIQEARTMGLAVSLATNGVFLAERNVLESLYQAGVGRIQVHLFSGDAALHQSLAGGQSNLEASLAAIERLVGDGIPVLVVVPLVADNLTSLSILMEKLQSLGVEHVHLTMPDQVRQPEMRATLANVRAAIAPVLRDGAVPKISFDRIPLCVAPNHVARHLYLRHRDPLRGSVEESALCWTCRDCVASSQCDAPLARGDDAQEIVALSPFLSPRSNSFNYIPNEFVADVTDLAKCPIAAGDVDPPEFDRQREFLMHARDRLITVATDSGDFTGPELSAVRDGLGQIYLDTSDKLLLDDFDRDLQPLRPATECTTCPSLGSCPGAFELRPLEIGFGASEARVDGILSKLTGRVLDVGVGEPVSLARVFDSAKHDGLGEMPFEYIGIEPDQERIDELSSRHPWLHLLRAGAEDADLCAKVGGDKSPFDHILLLRSYNHVRDLHVAFEQLFSMLKPGGTMLLVENTVFGVVRGRKKLWELEQMEKQGGAPFEHYRNHLSHEALEVLAPFDLEVLEHMAVGTTTANQWILWLRKPA
ncbi:MAG: hypothetical protein CMH54_02340 [Myxococcales bacterium]|nr:hypothetical protein [Myxococcales bacterium]